MRWTVMFLLSIQKGNRWSSGKVEGQSNKWGERKQVAPKCGQIFVASLTRQAKRVLRNA